MQTRRACARGRELISGVVAVLLVGPLTVLASVGAGAAVAGSAVTAPGGSYVALPPARIADTRSGLGGVTKGATRSLVVNTAGRGRVPATGVSAIAVNITVTGSSAAGFVTAFATGSPRPVTSNVNFARGQTVAQMAVVLVSGAGQLTLQASSPTQLVVDVEGYFTSQGTATTRGLFTPLDPGRIMDSRRRFGAGAPSPGGTSVLQVTGHGGVPPTGVSAVVINTTVTASTTAGYVTDFPTGSVRPATSTINFTRGQTVANRAIVPVSAAGKISFYNAAGTSQLVIDVAGYFSDGVVKTTGSYYVPVAATRVVDTRFWTPFGQPSAARLVTQQIAGDTCNSLTATSNSCGHAALVPPTLALTRPVAALLSVTALPAGSGGYLSVFPAGSPAPATSDVNFAGGAPVSNLSFVKLPSEGAVSVRDSSGVAKVVEDLSGYFALPAPSPTPAGVWMAQNDVSELSMHARTNTVASILAVVPGRFYTYALKADGTVWRWDKRPADTATMDSSASLNQLDAADLHGITAMADGQDGGPGGFVYALRSDGTVWALGYPGGTFAVLQVAGLNSVVQIGGAANVGYAIKVDGTVWAVGDNRSGLLGNGTRISSPAPVQVSGLSAITSISGDTTLAYAVDKNGDLWGWGTTVASLGHPATTSLVPVRLPGTCVGKSVFAGAWMDSFELCADGSVWQLDRNRTRFLSKVTALTGLISMSESPGGAQALLSGGTLWRETTIHPWAAVPGLTDITGIGGDRQYSYAVAAG
jgi:hypothetical protein